MMKVGITAVAATMLLVTSVVAQAEALKIGFLTTLSGSMAVLGQHARDGFLLAVKQGGGRLGGLEAKVIVEDDALKPELALTKSRQDQNKNRNPRADGAAASALCADFTAKGFVKGNVHVH